jgi:hypothetical protein
MAPDSDIAFRVDCIKLEMPGCHCLAIPMPARAGCAAILSLGEYRNGVLERGFCMA